MATIYSQVIASDDIGASDVSGPPDGLDTPVAVDQGGTNATVGSQGIANLLASKPTGLNKWRAALSKVLSGAGNARLVYNGDSTIDGIKNTTTRLTTPPMKLAARLANHYGITANVDCIMGNGASTNTHASHDDRFTSMGSWTTAGSTTTLGGYQFVCSAGTTAMVFQPYNQWDTITYWYWRQPGVGLGVMSLTINGITTNIDLNTGAAQEVVEVTYTVPAGLGAWSVSWARVSGTNVFILGWETRNSAVPSLQVYNCGWSASTSAQLASVAATYSPVPMISKLAADLMICEGGINDPVSGITTAQMVANFDVIAARQETVGSFIYQTRVPGNPAEPTALHSYAYQKTYSDALAAAALARNTGCINIFEAMPGGYDVWQPLGMYYDTFVHFENRGNAFMADFAFSSLIALT